MFDQSSKGILKEVISLISNELLQKRVKNCVKFERDLQIFRYISVD